jgi:NADH-quinone oxidoreductase subunit M
MPELHAPWLELAILLPLIAALVVTRFRRVNHQWLFSSLVTAVVLLVTIIDWEDFNSLGTFEAHDPHSLIQSVFAREFIVVDEFNAPLIAMATALYLAVVVITPTSKRERFPFGLTLISLALTLCMLSCRSPLMVIGCLAAQNFLPLVELRQRNQVWQFFGVYQAVSLLLILAGWLCVDTTNLATHLTQFGIVLMAAGLLIRCGTFPLHSWVVDLFDRASMGTALLFVTPMAGAYGLVRLVLPISPEWILQGISVVSLSTALYASGMVLVQTDTRRFYCYLFLSNSSLMLVGLESLTTVGLAGSLSLWLSIGLSLMSLGIVIRSIEGRVGRVTAERFHGLYSQMPALAVFFMIAILASIGFPGTVGFVGVELLVESAMDASSIYAVIVVIAVALNGIGALRIYFKLFTGTTAPATMSLEPRPIEKVVILLFSILIIVGGIFPQPGVKTRYHAAQELLMRRGKFFDITPLESNQERDNESQ